jgi:hypothetical protein
MKVAAWHVHVKKQKYHEKSENGKKKVVWLDPF